MPLYADLRCLVSIGSVAPKKRVVSNKRARVTTGDANPGPPHSVRRRSGKLSGITKVPVDVFAEVRVSPSRIRGSADIKLMFGATRCNGTIDHRVPPSTRSPSSIPNQQVHPLDCPVQIVALYLDSFPWKREGPPEMPSRHDRTCLRVPYI